MLVPSFGPTMNVIAYSPFQDGVSAEAVCGSGRAIASGAAHKPTRVLRQSGAMGLSSRLATAFEPGCAATTLDAHTPDPLEGVDLLDADEHAVAGVFVGESGAAFAGRDGPAVGVVGLVVDRHRRDVAEVADHPLHVAARGDVDAVGPLAVLHRRIGELRLAADAVVVDLAAGQAGLGRDEDAATVVRRQRDRAGRWVGARRGGPRRGRRRDRRLRLRE